MRILMVSPYVDITSLNTRMISAYLKREGHTVKHVFLLDFLIDPEFGDNRGNAFDVYYPEGVVADIVDLSRDCDLVGMSLSTNYFPRISKLTKTIREQTGKPVIWGGAHPTVAPEECMDVADYICVGEGEEAMADFVRLLEEKKLPEDIPNIWFRRGGKTYRNPPRPLIQNLDSLPYPDYDFDGQFVLAGNRLRPLSADLFLDVSVASLVYQYGEGFTYETMWTRGCPYHCSYCINNVLHNLYEDQKQIRRRSVEHLIGELEHAKSMFPRVNRVNFFDDCFIYASNIELEKFRDLYREKIDFPFFCNMSIASIKEDKLKILFEAGLSQIEIGIQSTSESTNRLYRRKYFTREQLQKATELLTGLLPPEGHLTYDLIFENPYETNRDVLETLHTLLSMPRPSRFQMFSLTFYPGTELHEKALKDGLIKGNEDVYLKDYRYLGFSYLSILFKLLNDRRVPRWFISVLAWTPLALLMETPPFSWFFPLLSKPLFALKRWRSRNFLKIRFAHVRDEG